MSLSQLIDYLSCQLGIPDYTTATILISFLIFGLGILANAITGRIKEGRKRKRLKDAFIIGVTELESRILKKKESFAGYAEQLKAKEHKDFTFQDLVLPFFDEIIQIPFRDYLPVFVPNSIIKTGRKGKIQILTRFSMDMGTLKRIESNYRDFIENNFEKLGEYFSEWNTNLQRYNHLYNQVVAKYLYVKDAPVDSYFSHLQKDLYIKNVQEFMKQQYLLRENLKETGDKNNPFDVYQKFITPLEVALSDIMPEEGLMEILNEVRKTKMAFDNYVVLRDYMGSTISNYAERYNDVHKSCENFLKEFK